MESIFSEKRDLLAIENLKKKAGNYSKKEQRIIDFFETSYCAVSIADVMNLSFLEIKRNTLGYSLSCENQAVLIFDVVDGRILIQSVL